jgi:tol-pal system protein YbgF
MVRASFAPLVLALIVASGPLAAASRAELEQRMDQLERKLDSQGLIEMNSQINRLRQELQQLRGELEVQLHKIERLERKQRDMYMDIDRRIGGLETRGQSGTDFRPGAGDVMMPPVPPSDGGVMVPPAQQPPGGGTTYVPPESSQPAESYNPAADTADVRQSYDAAFELLKQRRYTEASAEFKAFLKAHPDSRYASNAQYWIGEAHYVTREFKPAMKEFEKVISKYPTSDKVADARLKIGFIHYELKQWSQARDTLNDVIAGFPGSRVAQLAEERLARMTQEGH